MGNKSTKNIHIYKWPYVFVVAYVYCTSLFLHELLSLLLKIMYTLLSIVNNDLLKRTSRLGRCRYFRQRARVRARASNLGHYFMSFFHVW